MQPEQQFLGLEKAFWANVRTISQSYGYTDRRTGQIKVPSLTDVQRVLGTLGLTWEHLCDRNNRLTEFGEALLGYFEYRADVLNNYVESQLMDVDEAKAMFHYLMERLDPKVNLPLNKQTGEKVGYAYLTGMVNMLIESVIGGAVCDYDPKQLTTVTHEGVPVRTLARRVDGAFPSTVNPVAIWEIKEYYFTTTFGSRVADGVYETLLDGMELEDLRVAEGFDIKHFLIVDSHFTWWVKGRSYLCRIIDMLHMGYVDEVIFGREVVERIPALAEEMVAALDVRDRAVRQRN